MAFGVKAGTNGKPISRTTNYAVNAAELTDNVGEIKEMTTYGATMEVTEEYFVPKGQEDVSNEAISGQVGTLSLIHI